MIPRSLVLSAGFALLLALPLAAQTSAQKKTDDAVKKPTVDLSGSLDNSELAKQAPPSGVIVTDREWQRVSMSWAIKNSPFWRCALPSTPAAKQS